MTTLEKIRAEINDIEEGISSYYNDRPWVFKDEVLQIIDKYAEQEQTYNKLSFPNTFDEFVEQYGITDTDEVYTNGSKLIPAFRVKQWLMEANINGYTQGLKDSSKAEQEPTWIPVSERLPEAYGEYLITWTTSQSKRPFIAICEAEETSVFDHENYRFNVEWLLEDYIKAYPDVEVIAWMPLPEPYEKGGE